ncbi:radical SAM protein [Oscillatoria salina]|uniref:radical SAM protein n=1 Tax=Oscillatoria salina TaxID=331517 RepID=UPI0013B88290|nr:radical SAM protein [Oscillatoria salina]MBZ8179661.1 radical SAM protein [Oscillatoria salina IIICB1]NET89258.1 radical SAM protein [Kamptonema sp. SIO1D9]
MLSKTRKVTFVVKTSKLCNLRCRYCYEYAELGNKAAISLTQVEQMFRNIASYYRQLNFPVTIEFNWHGGETLLQPPEFYWQAFAIQRQVFGELADSVINSIQTNLTLLDNKRIDLLKNGFDQIGVSLDLFGSLRVDRAGNNSQPKVLKNIDRLRAENIHFGCITVLTKRNLAYIREIYQFYKQMNLSFRVLPLFQGAFAEQHEGFEITPQETLNAYCQLVDLWLEDEGYISIMPLLEYFRQISLHHAANKPIIIYDKNNWESIYLVNTTGDIYSVADAYNIERSHGNIFTHSLEDLILGKRHQQVIAEAEARMVATCTSCPYFGSCNGFPVAEGSRQYNEIDEQGAIRCIVEKGTLQHIEARLQQAGIIDSNTEKMQLKKSHFLNQLEQLVTTGKE